MLLSLPPSATLHHPLSYPTAPPFRSVLSTVVQRLHLRLGRFYDPFFPNPDPDADPDPLLRSSSNCGIAPSCTTALVALVTLLSLTLTLTPCCAVLPTVV